MIKYNRQAKTLIIPIGMGTNTGGGSSVEYVGGTNIDIDGNVINCTIDTSNLVTEDRLEEAVSEVEGKIPDVSGFATKDEVEEVENKIPSIAGLATEEYVNNKITEVEGKIPSVEGLASEAYVDGKVSDINAILEDKADKTDIPDISGKVDNLKGVRGIWSGTEEEYDSLEVIDNNVVYIIIE